jgi:hypothetical protein
MEKVELKIKKALPNKFPLRYSRTTNSKKSKESLNMRALVHDFRTADWKKIITYPALTMKEADRLLAYV